MGLYAINPRTQRCKWVAIDADNENSLVDLLKLQWELRNDGIEAAPEKSRRGGHLFATSRTALLLGLRHKPTYLLWPLESFFFQFWETGGSRRDPQPCFL
jgi:hypothetical protein